MINFLRPKLILEKNKIKEVLGEEYSAYEKLKDQFKEKPFLKTKVNVYYPGSGADIISLLLIHDIFLSKTKEVHFVFNDIRDFFEGILYQLEKYTQKSIIKIKEKPGQRYALAKFKDKDIHIHFYEADAMHVFPNELKKKIDIYYERSFEIFRSSDSIGFHRIHSNVKHGGLLMSDFGFNFGGHTKKFKKLSKIPKKFGHYKQFEIWQKK